MIINYLDELLDNILDTALEYFINNSKLVIKKNQDISKIIDELTIKLSIEKRINQFLQIHKISLQNTNILNKLYVIYYKYLYSYMLIFIGIKLFNKLDNEFISLVIFTHNNYLDKYLNSAVNSNILLLKTVGVQILNIINSTNQH